MTNTDRKINVVDRLKMKINKNVHIFIFNHGDSILKIFCDTIIANDSKVEIWCSKDCTVQNERIVNFSEEELNEVLDYYRLYDFSDKVTVITQSEQFGSLWCPFHCLC